MSTTFDMLVRAVGGAWVNKPGGSRGPLRSLIDEESIRAIAKEAFSALPKEVLIARGGCGGEPIAAGFREDGFGHLVGDVADFFGLDREQQEWSTWAALEAVPLIIKPRPPLVIS